MLGAQPGQLTGQGRVLAQTQPRLDVILQRRQPALVQPRGVGLEPVEPGKVLEQRTAPEPERLPQPLGRLRGPAGVERPAPLGRQLREDADVAFAGREVEAVPPRPS
ncbi:hypothetical protein GCM10020218_080180 [Dactylosporangium vinaceum]